MYLSRLSIKHQLFLIVAIIAFPAICIITSSGLQQRKNAIHDAKMETKALAETIVSEQKNLVASTRQLCIALSQLNEVKTHKSVEAQAIFAEILKLSPQYTNIFIADASGVVWASAVPLTEVISVSDRRYFKNALSSGKLSSGEYHIARTSKKATFNLGYPLKDSAGNVTAVICVGLALDHYYRHVFEAINLPKGSSFALIDHKGIILARAVESDKYRGKPSNPEIFKHMQEGPEEETSVGTSSVAGDNRIQTYRKLRLEGESTPYMYVRAGIPTEVVMAESNAALGKNLLIYTASLVVGLLFSWFISKKYIINRVIVLERSSQRLADGDLDTRVAHEVEGGELGALGLAFDNMAEKLTLREQALRESKNKYQDIFNTTHDALFIHDESGRIIEANKSSEQMFGYSRDEIFQLSVKDLISGEAPYSFDAARLLIEKALNEGTQEFEWLSRRKNGELFWSEIAISATGGIGGRLVLAVVRDISERKLAEDALASSERFLKTIIDTEPECIKLTDSDCNLLMMNPAGLEMIEADSLAQVKGQCLCPLITDPYRNDFVALTEQVFQGIPGTLEFEIVGLKGRHVWLETHAVPFRNERGEIVSLLGITRDITSRKTGEKALQESTNLLAEIIELSPISMAIVSMDGTIEQINRRAIETFGYSPDDIPNIEQWWLQAYPDESRRAEVIAQWMGLVGKALAEKSEIERREYQVTCKDGTVKSTLIFGILVSDKVFVIFDDITDRKRAEKERLSLERQLLQSQKMESLGVLAGGIAHDFNNILTSIMGNISYARMDLDASQHAYEPLARAEKAAKRAAGLAKQLLVFAKGGEPLKKVISVRQAVNEAVSLVLSGSRIKAVIDLPTDLHAVNADEGQIIQAFNNIIINAVQAMPDGGSLTVSARNITLIRDNSLGLAAGDYVKISFRDEGCGIAADDLEKIFDPYFTSKAGGSGLGLASTYSIIKKHGGHITVSSTPGRGANFTIIIPACSSPVAEVGNAYVSVKADGGYTILVMDDDEMVRELADITLKRLGHNVVCCAEGATAVSLYRSAWKKGEPFSLVIMDLTIPGGMGGIEAARKILAFDPEAQLVVSSGYSDDPVMANFAAYGFCASLEKPYNVEEIAMILRSCLLRKS